MKNLFSKKILAIGILFIFIFLLGMKLFSPKTTSLTNAEVESHPVKTLTITSQSFQPTEAFSGTVQGVQQTTVVPKIAGYIVSLKKEPGDHVVSGEVLATLEGGELNTLNKNSGEFLSASQASLDTTKKYLDQKVDEAEATLKKVRENRDAGDATDKDVSVAEESVQSAKKFRDAQISQIESGVVSARGNAHSAQASSENLVIKAPFSGIVTEKLASVGSYVSPGLPLYTIASLSDIEVVVSVPARIVQNITKGTPVSLLPKNTEQPISGTVFSTVKAVNPVTEETLVHIRFAKDADTSALLLGQYAKVFFPSAPSHNAFLIPESSLLSQYDEFFVFTIQNGKAKKQHVTLGESAESEREILSGLNNGDQLVVEGMDALSEDSVITNL